MISAFASSFLSSLYAIDTFKKDGAQSAPCIHLFRLFIIGLSSLVVKNFAKPVFVEFYNRKKS